MMSYVMIVARIQRAHEELHSAACLTTTSDTRAAIEAAVDAVGKARDLAIRDAAVDLEIRTAVAKKTP